MCIVFKFDSYKKPLLTFFCLYIEKGLIEIFVFLFVENSFGLVSDRVVGIALGNAVVVGLFCDVCCCAATSSSEREMKDGTAYVAIYECMATYKIIKKKEKRKGGWHN